MALPTTPLDKIRLVLFARMKKIHMAFLMVEKYWTTQRNHEFKKYTIILAFRGNLTFNDIRADRLSSQSLCLHQFQINMSMDYAVEVKTSQGLHPHPQDIKTVLQQVHQERL